MEWLNALLTLRRFWSIAEVGGPAGLDEDVRKRPKALPLRTDFGPALEAIRR
jgi:hypothetical protein